jgi:hypothetical protein
LDTPAEEDIQNEFLSSFFGRNNDESHTEEHSAVGDSLEYLRKIQLRVKMSEQPAFDAESLCVSAGQSEFPEAETMKEEVGFLELDAPSIWSAETKNPNWFVHESIQESGLASDGSFGPAP